MSGGLLPEGMPPSKRALDLLLTIPGLVLISPVMLLISALVGVAHGRPILFRQRRPGYRGRPFELLKFRTMTQARDAEGNLLPDDRRLTALGRLLRGFSLDELPELFNIIRGEMSLVGPRPLLMQYLDRYSPEQARRHDVVPGMTGWAQINGRNVVTWPEKFALDVWYVDHWSLWLDIKILAITLWKALRREGISRPGYATAPEFMGEDGHKQAAIGSEE